MLEWIPTHVHTALIYTTKTFALERSSIEQSEEVAVNEGTRFGRSLCEGGDRRAGYQKQQ
jgi:hypothetical protein